VSARIFLVLGGVGAALAVALGAAGMHALKPYLAANDPAGWFQTALTYHQWHSLGLLAVGLTLRQQPGSRWLRVAGWLLVIGLLLFCGNLYLRSLLGFHALHAVTPLGGMTFIAGWLAYAMGAWRGRD
jgi:uncharacterized membrane protein YgdD (TMEM256/DUF423 family)